MPIGHFWSYGKDEILDMFSLLCIIPSFYSVTGVCVSYGWFLNTGWIPLLHVVFRFFKMLAFIVLKIYIEVVYLFIISQIKNENHLAKSYIDQETEHCPCVNSWNPWTEAGGLLYSPGLPALLKRALSEHTYNQ